MKDLRTAKVVEMKRSPQMWSIKAGPRYVMGFMGADARERAIAFAQANFSEFTVVSKPTTKREQARLDAIAGLSETT